MLINANYLVILPTNFTVTAVIYMYIISFYLVENSVASTSGAGMTKHTDGTSHCLPLAFVIWEEFQVSEKQV